MGGNLSFFPPSLLGEYHCLWLFLEGHDFGMSLFRFKQKVSEKLLRTDTVDPVDPQSNFHEGDSITCRVRKADLGRG